MTVIAQFAEQKFEESRDALDADLVRHNVANFHAGNPRVYELTKFAERYNAENLRSEFALN